MGVTPAGEHTHLLMCSAANAAPHAVTFALALAAIGLAVYTFVNLWRSPVITATTPAI